MSEKISTNEAMWVLDRAAELAIQEDRLNTEVPQEDTEAIGQQPEATAANRRRRRMGMVGAPIIISAAFSGMPIAAAHAAPAEKPAERQDGNSEKDISEGSTDVSTGNSDSKIVGEPLPLSYTPGATRPKSSPLPYTPSTKSPKNVNVPLTDPANKADSERPVPRSSAPSETPRNDPPKGENIVDKLRDKVLGKSTGKDKGDKSDTKVDTKVELELPTIPAELYQDEKSENTLGSGSIILPPAEVPKKPDGSAYEILDGKTAQQEEIESIARHIGIEPPSGNKVDVEDDDKKNRKKATKKKPVQVIDLGNPDDALMPLLRTYKPKKQEPTPPPEPAPAPEQNSEQRNDKDKFSGLRLDAGKLPGDYRNRQKIVQVVEAINSNPKLMESYIEVSRRTGVDPLVIATLHWRENSCSTKYNSNGQGIYQDYHNRGKYPRSGHATYEEMVAQGVRAVEELAEKVGKGDLKKLNWQNPEYDEDRLWTAFLRYNGDAYGGQAKRVFGPNAKSYQGSPYVVNLESDLTDSATNPNWKQVLRDNGPMEKANRAIGARPLYKGLIAASSLSEQAQKVQETPAPPPPVEQSAPPVAEPVGPVELSPDAINVYNASLSMVGVPSISTKRRATYWDALRTELPPIELEAEPPEQPAPAEEPAPPDAPPQEPEVSKNNSTDEIPFDPNTFVSPVPEGTKGAVMTAPYGAYPSSGLPHWGIDLARKEAKDWEVLSVCTGTIEEVRINKLYANVNAKGKSGSTNYVWIKCDSGEYFGYAHMREKDIREYIKPGNRIKASTVIGPQGNQGNSDGPHLHLQINDKTIDGKWYSKAATVDPKEFLEKRGVKLPKPNF